MSRVDAVTAALMKVEVCAFSGYRIHPGHGKKLVRADQRSHWIINKKIEKHFLHKKGLTEDTKRKRTRKTQKVTRAIVGASVEMITKRRTKRTRKTQKVTR